jgi:hypothetical protein
MARRVAKIIQFDAKRRHVRGRMTASGEIIRLASLRRPPDDEGPRAA